MFINKCLVPNNAFNEQSVSLNPEDMSPFSAILKFSQLRQLPSSEMVDDLRRKKVFICTFAIIPVASSNREISSLTLQLVPEEPSRCFPQIPQHHSDTCKLDCLCHFK